MPITISANVQETIFLKEIDELYKNDGDPTYVIVRKATQAQHEIRQSFFAQLERRYNAQTPDEVILIQELSYEQLKRIEVYATLCECNIVVEDKPLFRTKSDKQGKPMLSMPKDEFDAAWGLLPPEIASAIHNAVREVNPIWGAMGEV